MATARTQVAVQKCSRTVGFSADRIDMWLLKLSLESMVTPRYLAASTASSA